MGDKLLYSKIFSTFLIDKILKPSYQIILRLFRATVATLIICCPSIYSLITSPNVNIFSEQDEPYYLSLAYKLGESSLGELLANEQAQSKPNAFSIQKPEDFLEFVLGKVAIELHIAPQALALLLDLLCCFSAYLIFAALFSSLCGVELMGEVGAIILLSAPWGLGKLFAFDPLISLKLAEHFYVVTINPETWSCVPILRGPQTQLSYPILGLALYLIISCIKFSAAGITRWSIAGIVSGILLYFYFFAWIVSGSLVLFLLILCANPFKLFFNGEYRSRRSNYLAYILGFIAASSPGVYLLLSRPSWLLQTFNLPPELPRVLFFPLALSLGIIVVWYDLRTRKNTDSRLIGLAFLATSFSLIASYNLQAFTRTFIQALHFFSLYLGPLLSATLGLYIIKRSAFTPKTLLRLWICIPILGAVTDGRQLWRSTLGINLWASDFNDLLVEIRRIKEPPRTIAVYFSTVPAYVSKSIELLTAIPTIVDNSYDDYFSKRGEGLDRKIAMRYLIHGQGPPLKPAMSGYPEPSDVLVTASTFFYQHHYIEVPLLNLRAANFSECDIIAALPIDYFIVDLGNSLTGPIDRGNFHLEPVWTSRYHTYQLISVTTANSSANCSMKQLDFDEPRATPHK